MPNGWIKTVMRRNYRWVSRRPEFTASELRNPATKRSVLIHYANVYLDERFPFGAPRNLITSVPRGGIAVSPLPAPAAGFVYTVQWIISQWFPVRSVSWIVEKSIEYKRARVMLADRMIIQ